MAGRPALELADDLVVSRVGYGAMQIAGPRGFGVPRDRDRVIAVLREAVELGAQVEENRRHLGFDVLDIVYLRVDAHGSGRESVAAVK